MEKVGRVVTQAAANALKNLVPDAANIIPNVTANIPKLRNVDVIRTAEMSDRNALYQLAKHFASFDDHYVGARCNIGETSPMLCYAVNNCLRSGHSLIVEDSKGSAVGCSLFRMGHRVRALDDLNEDVRPKTVDNDPYQKIDNIQQFCHINFWKFMNDEVQKVALLKVLYLMNDNDPEFYRSLLSKSIERMKNPEHGIDGVMCAATNPIMLKAMQMCGFHLLFDVPKQLYQTENGSLWYPSELKMATVGWLPFHIPSSTNSFPHMWMV